MGNSQEGGKYDQILKNFTFVSEVNDSQLKRIKIYELKNDPVTKIFQCQKQCTSTHEFQTVASSLKARKLYEHQNIVKILFVQENESTQMCSDNSQVLFGGEYFPRTLEQEFHETIQNNQIFNESYLWHLTLQIVNGCTYLQSQGKYHGDIRPKNILKDLEGTVKLAEFSIVPGNWNGFARSMSTDELIYAAPELLEPLRNRNSKVEIDFDKVDVFSLGMTLLELSTLQSSADNYYWKEKVINEDLLNKRVLSIQERGYSKMWYNLLLEMLSPVEARPSFRDLEEVLSHFEESILSHKPFFRSITNPSQIQSAQIPINQQTSIYRPQ